MRLRIALFLAVLFVFVPPLLGWGETLSWTAPTTYTDGTAIAESLTYQAFWSTTPDMAQQFNLGAAATSTSVAFSPAGEGMVSGQTYYFSVVAIAAGGQSDPATPLAWTVPVVAPTLTPSPPINLRIN